jgi:hypothetical protein
MDVPAPMDVPAETEPNILGFPAEVPEESDAEERVADDAGPDGSPPSPGLVFLKRADRVAGGALVLAGVAANVSLSLSWSAGAGPPGLSLVRRGVEFLEAGVGESIYAAVWQPLVIVLSGGLFVVLGLLLLIPARTHRLVGLLAMIVALAATAAVVLLLAETDWGIDRFGPGMWCAIAVPVLGLVGALKAMLTVPIVTLGPADQHPPTTVEPSA